MKYRENTWFVLVHKFLLEHVQQTTRLHGNETPELLILPRPENGYTFSLNHLFFSSLKPEIFRYEKISLLLTRSVHENEIFTT